MKIYNIILVAFIICCLYYFYLSYKNNYDFFQNVETIKE